MAGYNIKIAAGTDLATSDFKVVQGKVAQLVGFGFLAGGDTMEVLVSYDGGTNYEPCYDGDGNAVLLGKGGAAGIRNPVNLIGPGFFRVQRTAGKTDSIGAALVEETND
jgi:hypothetical protein